MNLLQNFEKDQIESLTQSKALPNFKAGDTLRVKVKISEGTEEDRFQMFEGLCIARKSRALGSSFTVRKISNGKGVERTFPLYSPKVDSIEVIKRGIVRRAILFYMRALRGKAARLKEEN
jgi:large subunit ribosomal protein L19